MRIVLTCPAYKRPDVFDIWCDAAIRLKSEIKNVEIIPLVAVSESSCKRICEQYSIDYIHVPNKPLGKKFNSRLKEAKKYNPDYVTLVGSDDIMSTKTMRRFIGYMKQGIDVIHVMDIYYFDKVSKRMKYCKGYLGSRKGEPLAPGRSISKGVLDQLGWNLWSDEENKFTDGWVIKSLRKISHTEVRMNLNQSGLMLLDIKSKINMTPFMDRPNNKDINPNKLKKHFNPQEVKKICAA